tara:strand:- start:1119 stop:1271 length:153 start_codon:yes stop_codon:yes gene_type:complete
MWKEWDDFEEELEKRNRSLKDKEETKMRNFKKKKKKTIVKPRPVKKPSGY